MPLVDASVDFTQFDANFDQQVAEVVLVRPYTDLCLKQYVRQYHIPAVVIHTYLDVEGGKAGTVRINTNGTLDVGPMQINSSNFSWLKKELGYTPREIIFDGCKNLHAGAFIIRHHLDSFGPTDITDWSVFFEVASRYHSKTPLINQNYQKRWAKQFNKNLENFDG